MIILILGKPGSGKGTQAKLLAERFGLFYFSTGDFSRELALKDPRIHERMHVQGLWIEEAEMTGYVKDFLEEKIKETKDIIFDGYPRYASQYTFLKNWLAQKGLKIDAAPLIKISDTETIRRQSARRICEKCGRIYNLITAPPPKDGACVCGGKLIRRKDDTPAAIKSRLKEYATHARPVEVLAQKDGILVEVDGERSVEAIQADLVALLEGINAKKD